jgi:hypothetical protein
VRLLNAVLLHSSTAFQLVLLLLLLLLRLITAVAQMQLSSQ